MNTKENKLLDTDEEIKQKADRLIETLKVDHPEYSDTDAKEHALRLLKYKCHEIEYDNKHIDTLHESELTAETEVIQNFAKAVQKLRSRGGWRIDQLMDELYYQYNKSPLDIPKLN